MYDKNIYVFNKYNNQAIKQVIISNYISGPYTYRKFGLYFLKFSSSSSSPSSQFETLRSDPEFRRNSRVVFRGAPVISPKPQRSHT